MKRILFSILFFSFILPDLLATHNRAGEITYEWISGTTYEVTITTYTRESVAADRCELLLNWGDQSSSNLPRINGPRLSACASVQYGNGQRAGMGEFIGNDVKMNIYQGRHTYSTVGVYILSFEDPNRNAGISNIIQSVYVPFYVQSELVISPSLGPNSSPKLLNPPIDDGCHMKVFKHNAGAFDADGDSLAYELVECRTAGGTPISTIYDPQYVQDSIKIDPVTGDLIWDVPKNLGQYNFAIQINEYRKNGNGEYVRIGYVVRDLQIDIGSCGNNPPEIQPVGPFCVEAGELLSFDVTATDDDLTQVTLPDGSRTQLPDTIKLTAFGGPFDVTDPANPFYEEGFVSVTGTFSWQTSCFHVRKQPWYVTFEATDGPVSSLEYPLVDVFTTEIRVIAPAPKNPLAVPDNGAIDLIWEESICKHAVGYRIYRREDSYGFVPSDCETGVPAYTGYELIATNNSLGDTTYTDTLDLKKGVRYCYMVVAFFEDEAESYASEEFCASLPLTLPLMTNVDVLTTNAATGSIDVKWTPPPVIDSANFPPPYSYTLFRAQGLEGENFIEIQTFNGLLDTSFTDNNLNTEDTAYRYRVDFFSGPENEFVGSSDPASSVYLEITPFDEGNRLDFTHNTPWQNYQYIIYREDPTGSGNFSLLDTAYSGLYNDTGLVNGDNYCYYVEAYGQYTASDSLPKPLINRSQIRCSVPVDTNAPCSPLLSIDFNCQGDSLILQWTNPSDAACSKNDVKQYNIYYKSRSSDLFPTMPKYQVSSSQNILELVSSSDGDPLVGCYAVSAVDDADEDANGEANESLPGNIVCVEACPLIDFPNVFTPNRDGNNDIFTAISANDIREMRISIHNRWGTEVYQTNNGNEFLTNGWDGTDMNTGEDCTEGVYYYICRFTPLSIESPKEMEVSGFVHLFR